MSDVKTEEPKANIQVQRLYVKDLSYRVPQAPGLFISADFKEKWEPSFSFEMHVKHQGLTEERHEVTLHATVVAKSKSDTTPLTIDIQQAGIFLVQGYSAELLPKVLSGSCVAYLYPYLARSITDASIQAGFPPIMLSPLNLAEAKDKDATKELSGPPSLNRLID